MDKRVASRPPTHQPDSPRCPTILSHRVVNESEKRGCALVKILVDGCKYGRSPSMCPFTSCLPLTPWISLLERSHPLCSRFSQLCLKPAFKEFEAHEFFAPARQFDLSFHDPTPTRSLHFSCCRLLNVCPNGEDMNRLNC